MRLDHIFQPLHVLQATTPKALALNNELAALQTRLEQHVATGPAKISGLPASSADFLNQLENAERETIRTYRTPLLDAAQYVANLSQRYAGAALEADGIAVAADAWNKKLISDLDAVFKKYGCAPHGEHVHCEELGLSRDKAARASTCAELARSAARKLPKNAAEFASVMNALVADPRRGRPLKIESINNYSIAHEVGGPSRVGYGASV